jgi:hypothetical protein
MTRISLPLPEPLLAPLPADLARLASMPPLKVGLLVDAIGGGGRTPAQECADIISELAELGGLPARAAWAGTKAAEGLAETDIDLLVFDYGAMWQHEEVVTREIDAVQAWATHHPGKVALLWSGFTCWVYAEAEKTFAHLDNVWYRYAGEARSMRDSDAAMPDLWAKLQAWYGVRTPGGR